MPRDEAVAEEDDRCKDSEELPCGGDDGAGEGAKVTYTQEDEELEYSVSTNQTSLYNSPDPKHLLQKMLPTPRAQLDVSE